MTITTQTIGKRFPRTDYKQRVMGKIPYPSDITVPNMLESAIVRSPFAHAEIVSIDIEAALEVEGVVAILNRDDFSDIDPYFGSILLDQPILAIEKVRYEGEPVVAIAAKTKKSALEAADLVDIEYNELPVLDSIDKALSGDAPKIQMDNVKAGNYGKNFMPGESSPGEGRAQLNESAHNIAFKFKYQNGDIEKGFEEAEYTFENTYEVPIIHHYPLEPIHSIGSYEKEEIKVWTGTQTPIVVREDIARMFKYPQSQVRIISHPAGGAFGAKAFSKVEPLAVALSKKAGYPVRISLSMADTARTIRRAGLKMTIKTGVTKEGKILARKIRGDFQIGGYSDCGQRVCQKGGFVSPGPYKIPHLDVATRAIYTNTPPSGAYRGFGTPQVTWAYERHTDELAKEINMDPVEFRALNLLERGEIFAKGETSIDTDFEPPLRELADIIGWSKQEESWIGTGIAVSFKPSQAPTESTAVVRLHSDASMSVLMGTAEIGQGALSVMAQIAAEEASLPIDSVKVNHADTGMVPFDTTTTASRSTVSVGKAVQRAAEKVKNKMITRTAELFNVSEDEVKLNYGQVEVNGEVMSYEKVIELTATTHGLETVEVGQYMLPTSDSPLGGSTAFWEPVWVAAKVKVNPNTGKVNVLSLQTILDAGKAINLQQVEGQDMGSAVQGLGAALFEEMKFEDGALNNPTFIQYRVPLIDDLPHDFGCVVIENEDGPGPFGSKGVGEGAIMAVPAAVGNAVANAIKQPINELPLTPEKVWKAIKSK